MSCNRESERFGRLAGVKAGIGTLSNKAGSVAGAIATRTSGTIDQLDRVGVAISKNSAPYTRLLAGSPKPAAPAKDTERQTEGWTSLRRAGTTAAIAVGAATGRIATGALVRVNGPARTAMITVKLSEQISSELGNAAGKLSAGGDAGQVEKETRRFFFFKGTRRIPFWKSSLTPLLNKPDAVVGLKKRDVISSTGAMFQAGGKTWHQGSTVVNVEGQARNVTHLQSLSLPARHYFFDRPISIAQSVSIAAGEIKAADVPGFKGQVSRYESIAPIWAGTKQGLIRAQIYWPAKENR